MWRFLEDVYRSVLDLNGSTRPRPRTRACSRCASPASCIAPVCAATVRARAEGEQILVDIDEGRLDKVIFLGARVRDAAAAARSDIDTDVFNQPDLERQLRASGAARLGEFAYEIVPGRR